MHEMARAGFCLEEGAGSEEICQFVSSEKMYFSAPESAVELFFKLHSILQALYILSRVKVLD